MKNLIIAAVLVAVAGLALFYILRAKKRGQKCIGCPYSGKCGNKNCGCGTQNKEDGNR